MGDDVTTETSRATNKKPKMGIWLLLVGAVIMLSGLLFGFDQGVIALKLFMRTTELPGSMIQRQPTHMQQLHL
jgi:hypothetical protein